MNQNNNVIVFLLTLLLFLVPGISFAVYEPVTSHYSNPRTVNPSNMNISSDDMGMPQYMRDLHRRLKSNWKLPKGEEDKRVVLLFEISKDGKLLSNKVFKSSGSSGADNAALQAVNESAPFNPLPSKFDGSSLNIQFTFPGPMTEDSSTLNVDVGR